MGSIWNLVHRYGPPQYTYGHPGYIDIGYGTSNMRCLVTVPAPPHRDLDVARAVAAVGVTAALLGLDVSGRVARASEGGRDARCESLGRTTEGEEERKRRVSVH